jgi:hypothetical protein
VYVLTKMDTIESRVVGMVDLLAIQVEVGMVDSLKVEGTLDMVDLSVTEAGMPELDMVDLLVMGMVNLLATGVGMSKVDMTEVEMVRADRAQKRVMAAVVDMELAMEVDMAG